MTPTLPFLEVEEAPTAIVRVESPLSQADLADSLLKTLDRLHTLIDLAAVAGPTSEMEADYTGIHDWLRLHKRPIRSLLAMAERQPQNRLSTWNPNGKSWDELMRAMRGRNLAAESERAREMRRLADACRAQARRARSALAR